MIIPREKIMRKNIKQKYDIKQAVVNSNGIKNVIKIRFSINLLLVNDI
jgi:hypothetical protein